MRRSPLWAAHRRELGTVLAQSSPQGARDLATLARQSPSPLTRPDALGHSTLSNLARMSSEPLAEVTQGPRSQGTFRSSEGTLRREDLVNGTLSDLARPEAITQGAAGSCGVASVLQPLARNQPAEYVRLTADLATTGRARMRGGPTGAGMDAADPVLVYVPGAPPTLDRRSASSRLLQNAAMENTNGRATYDPTRDAHTGTINAHGTYAHQSAALASQLNGTPYTTTHFDGDSRPGALGETLRAGVAQASPQRGPVIAGLTLEGGGGHAVEVRSIAADGQVVIRDPNASSSGEFERALPGAVSTGVLGEYRVPLTALQNRVHDVSAPVDPALPVDSGPRERPIINRERRD